MSAFPRFKSTSQAGLFFTIVRNAPVRGLGPVTYSVVSRLRGGPAISAHDDDFASEQDALAVARQLAGETQTPSPSVAAPYRDDLFESFIAADCFLTHMATRVAKQSPDLLPRYREALFSSEVLTNPEMLARWNAWCVAVKVTNPQTEKSAATAQHTPGPWQIDRSAHFKTFQIVGRMFANGGMFIAEIPYASPDGEANAELIVRAVNSHNALLEALKGAKAAFDHMPDEISQNYAADRQAIDAALAMEAGR